MELLDMHRFIQHSTARVHPSSSGLIFTGTSHGSFTRTSDSRCSQLKRSHTSLASYLYRRSQQTKGDKKTYLWTEPKPSEPEFNHEMTGKALWVPGWSTPAWLNARPKLFTHCRLQCRVSYSTRDWCQVTAQGNGKRHMHDAGSTSETIAVSKDRLQLPICELESMNLVEGGSTVASSRRISPVAQKIKQLIDARSEYEKCGDALLSSALMLRLRDFLEKKITTSLPQSDSGNHHGGVGLSTFAKSHVQACVALVEEELMEILPATMNQGEMERVKNTFKAVLPFESAMLDSAYARTQSNGELAQQSSSPWHPFNIIFTTDFDVTCTIVDSGDSLVRAAESAAKESSGDFRPGKLLEDYVAILYRHAIRTARTLQSLENPEKSIEVSKRLSGRDENSEDVVPGMDPSLKPLFESTIKTSSVSSSEDTENVPFDEAGLRRALTKLSDLEVLCNKDIMSSGVLSGFTRNGVLAEAKLVELRPYAAGVLKQLVGIGTQIHVVSANWSRDLIIGGLPSIPESKLFVHCNDMRYDSEGVSTGIVDNTLVDAFDKEQMLRALRTLYSHYDGKNVDLQDKVKAQADGKAGRMLVYMGDSHTDLLGLLEADLGIAIGLSAAARKVMSLYGIKLLPLVEASASISRARLNGSRCSWRRSGILFEALGWDDIGACLFGVAETAGTANSLESSGKSSEDPSVQQRPLVDTTDMSQERPPPSNLELVQVAC